MSQEDKPSVFLNFVLAGSAGTFAACCLQPIDYIKVHIQVMGEGVKGARPNPFSILANTVRSSGLQTLYTGLSAMLLRQVAYTSVRLGTYKTLTDAGTERRQGSLPVWERTLYSLTAGAIAAFTGNPTDLVLIRMQSEQALPEARRRGYTGTFNGLSRIIKEEGISTLWRASILNVFRMMMISLGTLMTYDVFKEELIENFGEFYGVRGVASCGASLVSSVLSLPFDNLKTKYQNMKAGADGKYPYSSFIDCFTKSYKIEGFRGLYVGFGTYFVREAPFVILLLVTTDLLNKLFNKSH